MSTLQWLSWNLQKMFLPQFHTSSGTHKICNLTRKLDKFEMPQLREKKALELRFFF